MFLREREMAQAVEKAFREGWAIARNYPNHDPRGIEVKIEDGKVTLTGQISTGDFGVPIL